MSVFTRYALLLVIGASSSVAIVWLAALMFAEVLGTGDQGRLAVIAALMFVAFLTLLCSIAARSSAFLITDRRPQTEALTNAASIKDMVDAGWITAPGTVAHKGSDR